MEKINLTDFQKRKFKKNYICIYIVNKEIKIRTETSIADRELTVLFGVDIMGNKEIIGMYFENTKNNRYWLEKFEELKSRNVQKILFFVTPHNKNIERCIKIIYNETKIINSPDSIQYGISRFFADHPSRKMQTELKDLFLLEDKKKFLENLKIFKEMYVDNKFIEILLDKNEKEIEEFYQYNYDLRKLFYPYYTIKEMRKYLNKIKNKEPLCTNINEVIEFTLPYINSFEKGRTYSKKAWLELISKIYEEYVNEMEEYLK